MTRPLIALSFATACALGSSHVFAQSPASNQTTEARPRAGGTTFGGFWSTNFASAAVPPSAGNLVGRRWNGGGATVEVPLAGRFSFDGRLMWNRRGARVLLPGTNGFQEMSADYLSAPLLVRVSSTRSLRPYAVAGLEVSFRLKARTRLKTGMIDATEESTKDTKPFDLAASMGAGVERRLARSSAFVEALYSHGLNNVFATSSDVSYAKTRTVTLLAGVRF